MTIHDEGDKYPFSEGEKYNFQGYLRDLHDNQGSLNHHEGERCEFYMFEGERCENYMNEGVTCEKDIHEGERFGDNKRCNCNLEIYSER